MSRPDGTRDEVARLGILFSARLVHYLLLALGLLVLYGALPERSLGLLLLLFVAARAAFLVREVLLPSLTPAEQRREASELVCEGLGLLAFSLLLPIDVALYTRDFVSFRGSQGWLGLGVAALCVALYAWPHIWSRSPPLVRARRLWWALPFFPALLLLVLGIAIRHPYLDPSRKDRAKLAAERVLALQDNVVAGSHADWVFARARQLEDAGERSEAIRLYRRGLQLDPHAEKARARLARLEAAGSPGEAPSAPEALARRDLARQERARAPLWAAEEVPPALLRCDGDASLASLERTTLVIVRVGDVSTWFADVVGEVLRRELGLPTCAVSERVPLPPHTRVRGLVFGRQWSLRSLVEAFLRARQLPEAPVRYLLLTPADIYSEDSNFVFSASFDWGALVSYARFARDSGDELGIVQRLAKQSLGALLKSFDVPASSDPNCVTSYTNGLRQFDAKGNRPNAESLAIFRRALRELDARWLRYKTGAAATDGMVRSGSRSGNHLGSSRFHSRTAMSSASPTPGTKPAAAAPPSRNRFPPWDSTLS